MEQTRQVRFDREKLEYLRIAKGLTVDAIVDKSGKPPIGNGVDYLDRRTVIGALNGEPKTLDKALWIARTFGYDDPIPLLLSDDVPLIGPPSTWNGPATFLAKINEWNVEAVIEPLVQTANGLKYEVCKLSHQYLPDRFARGKCFDVSGLSTRERARIAEFFHRHPEVCTRLVGKKHVARNLTATMDPTGQFWWCLDEWQDGETLAMRLDHGPLTTNEASAVMRQVGIGLQSLHSQEIIRRDLSPRHILLTSPNEEVVLNDFEMAKLLDGSPTVSPSKKWPDDEYRAPEVRPRGPVDVRTDIYSWGRNLIQAVTGVLPARGNEATAFKEIRFPPRLLQLVLACVRIAPSDRPSDFDVVLKGISNWK